MKFWTISSVWPGPALSRIGMPGQRSDTTNPMAVSMSTSWQPGSIWKRGSP